MVYLINKKDRAMKDIKKQIRKVLFITKLFGTLNYYKGIEKLTVLDYAYKRRISFSTALKIAKIIYL